MARPDIPGFDAAAREYESKEPAEFDVEECQLCEGVGLDAEGRTCTNCEGTGKVRLTPDIIEGRAADLEARQAEDE